MKPNRNAVATAMLAFWSGAACADPVPVNAGNFARAESNRYMDDMVAVQGLGLMTHRRTPTRLDEQNIIRMNLDTLYSSGVFDLAAGPVTVTLPPVPDGRYLAVQPVSEDHFTAEVFHDGSHILTEEDVGTRYVALLMRVFVDSRSDSDIAAARALQDQLKVEQVSAGAWEIPEWDKASLDAARQALLDLAALGDGGLRPKMGARGKVDPIGHLLATAGGWGLNPESEAIYVGDQPAQNDGVAVHRMTLKDVPVDGFWSVTVYDRGGFMVPNELGVNAVNNVTALADADGSVTVQFGGCDGAARNCVPVTEGWNYVLRLYRPRAEVRDGSWQAPRAEPVN